MNSRIHNVKKRSPHRITALTRRVNELLADLQESQFILTKQEQAGLYSLIDALEWETTGWEDQRSQEQRHRDQVCSEQLRALLTQISGARNE